MTQPLNSVTGDAGVNGVGLLVVTRLGWYFRPQPVADIGIDAQVEPMLDGGGSGRLLGLQIKSGTSMFDEPAPDGDGWVYRENTHKHRDYWLRYQLPVLLVLYDIDGHAAYWQLITPETAVVTGAGFKVVVPASQRLDAAAAPTLATLARQMPRDVFEEALAGLPASCAARLRSLQEDSPALAQQLASRLVAGRDEPAATVEKITATGTDRWPWRAWAAVGDYANEYGLASMTATCLERAEDSPDGAVPPGRYRALAGLLLAGHDPDRARAVLAEASASPGGAMLAAIGVAWLDHDQRPGPVAIPAMVNEHADQANADPTILRFVAEQRLRAGDVDAAIGLHEKALALVPDAPGQQLALAEALLRRSRPTGGGSHTADYRAAANLAAAARAARRRCRADSTEAAEILLHALTLGGDERSAIRVATPQPDGEATQAEAASSAVAFYAARLSYELGDLEAGDRFTEVVTASGRPEWITQCAAVRAEACGESAEQRISLWQQVIAAGVSEGQRLVALQSLARLGCWPLPDLDAMRDAGYLAPGMYDALHAQALAAGGDADTALALLRGGQSTSLIIAEAYARQLAALGQVEECLRLCDQASLRFGDPRLSLFALDVLTHAGRIDDVIGRATTLLARQDLPFHVRHRVRGNLINTFTERRDWISCERLGREGWAEAAHLRRDLTSGKVDPLTFPTSAADELAGYERDYAWTIIISQYNQGAADLAFETLQALHPHPGTLSQMQTWSDLHRMHGWTLATAEQALTLAEQDSTPPEVAGKLLFSLLQCCQPDDHSDVQNNGPGTPTKEPRAVSAFAVPVSQEVYARLNNAWNTFVNTHHPSGVRRLGFDEQLQTQLHELIAPGTRHYRQAREAIQAGRLPLGALSLAADQPYLLSLLHQAAEIIPAVDPASEAYDLELQAARTALGTAIAVDGTALYVVAAIAELWPAARDAFLALLLAEPTAHDILVSHVAARSTANMIGSLSLLPETGQLHYAELTEPHRRRLLDHSSRVHTAAQGCRLTAIADLDNLGAAYPIKVTGAWLSPVAVSLRDSVTLYSDDAVLRAWARAKGVPTFGTLALVETLIERGRPLPDTAEAIITKLFYGGVVDLPTVWPLVVQAAETTGPTTPAVLLNVARSAFWRGVDRNDLGGVIVAVARSAGDDPVALAAIVTAMADGLTAALEPANQILAVLGATVLAHASGVSAQAAGPVIHAIQQVAARYDIDPVPLLRQHLTNVLSDPSDAFRMSPDAARQAVDEALAASTDLPP